jgi:hypothetical protein
MTVALLGYRDSAGCVAEAAHVSWTCVQHNAVHDDYCDRGQRVSRRETLAPVVERRVLCVQGL